MNTLTVAELKRRGMAAIEEGLRRGPLHIVKRSQSTGDSHKEIPGRRGGSKPTDLVGVQSGADESQRQREIHAEFESP